MRGYGWRKKVTVTSLILFFAATGGFLHGKDSYVLKAQFTSVAPEIDGELDEQVWKKASRAKDFYIYTGERPATEKTEAYLLYDNENIYVAFICHDSGIGGLKSEENVFKGDEVELFIDPGRTLEYTHIAVNPKGKTYLAWQQGNRPNNVRTAAKILKDRWQVEMAVPFEDIKFPEPGKMKPEWGINFCRGNTEIKEWSNWSPTVIGFHNPFKFGELQDMKIDSEKFFLSQQKSDKEINELLRITTDRTFYDNNELSASVDISGVTSLKGTSLKINVTDAAAGNIKTVKTVKPVLLTNREKVDISSLPAGDYRLNISLVNNDGSIIGKGQKNFYKIEPPARPDDRVEIKDNLIYLNGKLFFPIIVWFGTAWNYPETVGEKDLQDIRSKGFDAIMPGWECFREDLEGTEEIWGRQAGNPASRIQIMKKAGLGIREVLDLSQKNGLRVVLNIPWIWGTETLTEKQIELGGKTILKYRDHPSILCWFSHDETDGWTEMNRATYKMHKELDPYRPVYLNLIQAVASNKDAADILSTDPYPIGKTAVTKVSVHADVLRKVLGESPGQSFLLVLQMFGSPGEGWPRCPSPREERCMVFLAMNHGVKGLAYFNYFPEKRRREGDKQLSEELWNYMGELNRQAKKMSLPYLLGKAVDGVSSDNDKLDIASRLYEGDLYVTVINTSDTAVSAVINVPADTAKLPKKIDVLFESRNVPAKNNVIEDDFSGYDVHIYKIPGGVK